MPYVNVERRATLDKGELPANVGEANYLITKELIAAWLEKPRYETIHRLGKEYFFYSTARSPWSTLNFEDYTVARGLAFMEFYSRVARHYEDQKIAIEGEVYPDACFPLFPKKEKEKRK